MGIGRRELLRQFGAGIAAAAGNSLSAVAIVDDYYVNRRLGIAFEKPRGWIFAGIREMGEVKAGQILDLDDLELSREAVDSVELPIVAISRDRLSGDAERFTPGVTVYLEDIAGGPGGDDNERFDLIRCFSADVSFCAAVLKDFRVRSASLVTEVSACNAIEYEAAWVFEHENMLPTPVRMKTLVIDHGTALYTLRMYDSPYAGTEFEFDYSSFIASVRMV